MLGNFPSVPMLSAITYRSDPDARYIKGTTFNFRETTTYPPTTTTKDVLATHPVPSLPQRSGYSVNHREQVEGVGLLVVIMPTLRSYHITTHIHLINCSYHFPNIGPLVANVCQILRQQATFHNCLAHCRHAR
ncbi:hypothetical protein PNOK_0542400 [Pyrrhoderma noxium]|uniref:Uncharacterized protein n=1 Tax=Pyrrhoderma noxium TaxID=2282107 RepID=A0A286UG18_9AGAM|nr:hypothetical protein PNOK_0542400 [Pyrrhoderma noxium]